MVHPQTAGASERQAIAEPELGQSLERTPAERRQRASAEQFDFGALLAGLIFDETGRPLRPVRVNQGARRYRFYLGQALQQREQEAAGLRLPAHQLEKLVLETTLEALKAEVGTRALAVKLAGASDRVRRQFLRLIIRRAEVRPSRIRLELHGMSCHLFQQPVHVMVGGLPSIPAAIEIPHEFSPKGRAFRRGDLSRSGDPHPALIKAVVRGYLWRTELLNGTIETIGQLVKKVRFRREYVLRLLRLGFLAPDLIEAMLNGRLPLAPNLTLLKRPLPLDWAEQREFFGLSAQHNNSASSAAAATRIIPLRSTNSPKLH
jgi:site-specific DNA recombinase